MSEHNFTMETSDRIRGDKVVVYSGKPGNNGLGPDLPPTSYPMLQIAEYLLGHGCTPEDRIVLWRGQIVSLHGTIADVVKRWGKKEKGD